METIVLTIHIVLAVVIIALVLMQQGKGAGMGASFGSGASGTVFGSQGSVSFFTKITSLCIMLFFVTSLLLAWVAQRQYYGQASGVNELLQTIENSTVNDDSTSVQESNLPTDLNQLDANELDTNELDTNELDTLPNLQNDQASNPSQ